MILYVAKITQNVLEYSFFDALRDIFSNISKSSDLLKLRRNEEMSPFWILSRPTVSSSNVDNLVAIAWQSNCSIRISYPVEFSRKS